MDDIKIKKVCAADIDFIKEIEIECGLSPWSKEDYLQEVTEDNPLFLAAKNKEEVFGFILARLIMTQPFNSNEKEFELEIYNIAVKKEFRREKIATSLINKLIEMEIGANVKKIHLEVRESNVEGINFYRRNLFRVTGKRRNFYSNPTEDAILMTLNLAEEKNT